MGFMTVVKIAFAPFYVIYRLLKFFVQCIGVLLEWLGYVIELRTTLFTLSALWFLSLFFFNYGFTLIENVESIWRCFFYPLYETLLKPFFDMIFYLWDYVCWWNLIGEIQRLFSGKIVWRTLANCENGFYIWDFVTNVVKVFISAVKMTVGWFFVGNPLSNQIPTYPLLRSTADLLYEFGQMVECLCAHLRPLFALITRILISNNVLCGIHQLINAGLSVLQLIVNTVIDIFTLVLRLFTINFGDLAYFIKVISGEIPGFTMPTLVPTTERASAAAWYIGQWLNDILQTIICTIVSEVSSQGDDTIIDDLYEDCMTDPLKRYDLFSILGPLVGIFFRFSRVEFSLAIHIFTIMWQFLTLPPGPRFITDEWPINQLYDTLRIPPSRYDYTSSINVLTEIPGTNLSSIIPLKPNLYGPYTNVSDLDCASYSTSRFIIPCKDCPEVEEYDIETCVCSTSHDIDRIFMDVLDFKLLDGILCCFGARVMRVGVALVKFVQGGVVHIFTPDRLGDYFTDYNVWNEPIDELIGKYNELGGLLACCARILNGFDPRLECLCGIVVNLVKPLGEAFRILLLAVIGILNMLFNTNRIKFFDIICTTKPTCVNLEDRIFQYLRRDRPNTIGLTGLNYLNTYLDIKSGGKDTWIDCFCELISFNFLNQFINDGATLLPDFCCGIEFVFRIGVGITKAGMGTLFAVFETVGSLFETDRPFTIVFIGYLACDTVNSCAPIASILSDILDFLKCGCTFIKSIDDIIDPRKEDIKCFCIFINGCAYILYYGLKSLAAGAQLVAQLLNCAGRGFPDTVQCRMGSNAGGSQLMDRLISIFDNIDMVTESMGDVVGTVGCVLGLLFQFDCVGARYYSPEDWPMCTQGSYYGTCAMGDRLTRFFKDSFELLIIIPKFMIDTVKSFGLVAFNFPFNGFTGVADMLRQLLYAISDPLWGTPDDEHPTTGWMQSFCLLLDCLLGPDTDECMGSVSPSLDQEASSACIGDLFCVLGNIGRDISGAVIDFICSGVGILEALLAGNGELLADRIIEFIKAFFNILLLILGSAGTLLDAIIATIVGIASAIVGDGFGMMLDFVLRITTGFAKALLEVIGVVVNLFGKRTILTAVLGPLTDDDIDRITDFLGGDDFFDDFAAHAKRYMGSRSILGAINENQSRLVYVFANHFKFSLLEKEGGEGEGEGDRIWHRDDDFIVYDQEQVLKRFMTERKKRSLNGEDEGEAITLDDLRALDFQAKSRIMFGHMTEGSYCKMVMEQTKSARGFHDLSFPEELIWKFCFTAYGLPIGLNSYVETDEDGIAVDDSTTNVYSPTMGITVPDDMFYDPVTFFTTTKDMLSVLTTYGEWSGNYKDITSDAQNYVEIKTVPEWFWEYEKEIYAKAQKEEDDETNNTTMRRSSEHKKNGDSYKRVKRSWTIDSNVTSFEEEEEEEEREAFKHVFIPKESSRPRRFLHHEDEIWERIEDNLIFINLPGDQLSVPILNGRYPVYHKGTSFAEHIKQKGLDSPHISNFVKALINHKKQKTETIALNIFSTFDHLEKEFRESQYSSIDEYGNYKPERNHTAWTHQDGSYKDTTGLSGTWNKVFQMNTYKKMKEQEALRGASSSSSSSSSTNGTTALITKRQFDEEMKEASNFYVESALTLAYRMSVMSTSYIFPGITSWINNPVIFGYNDYPLWKRDMWTTKYKRSDGLDSLPLIDYEQEGLKVLQFAFDELRIKRNAEQQQEDPSKPLKFKPAPVKFKAAERKPIHPHTVKKSVDAALNFPYTKYMTSVVPATLSSVWGRMTNTRPIEKSMFKHYVEKRYDSTIPFEDIGTQSIIDPEGLSEHVIHVFNTPTNMSSPSSSSSRRSKIHVLSYDHLYKDFKGKFFREPKYLFDGSPNPKKLVPSEDDLANDIRMDYGHILGDKSLVTHRLAMMSTAASNYYSNLTNHVFSLERIQNKFHELYIRPYLKLYSDTVRVHHRVPSLWMPVQFIKRQMERVGYVDNTISYETYKGGGVLSAFTDGDTIKRQTDENWSYKSTFSSVLKTYVNEALHDDSPFIQFLMYGDSQYDTIDPNHSKEEHHQLQLKRSHDYPIIPICLPGDTELRCHKCDKCPMEECHVCQHCTNCTEHTHGRTECEQCASCAVGGPRCTGGCSGCEECDREASCLDCIIIEEIFSVAVDLFFFCRALDENDTSVIKRPPPGTPFIKILYYDDNNPPEFSDPISRLFFKVIGLIFGNVDIGATAIDFSSNTNMNPLSDSIGLAYIIYDIFPWPFTNACNRDIHLQGTFGMGLEEGLKWGTIITVVFGGISWFVVPPFAGIFTTFFMSGGWLMFWLYTVMRLSWFYSPYCLLTPNSFIYEQLFPFVPVLPMFSAKMGPEIQDLMNKWITPCYSFIQTYIFGPLSDAGDTCLTCPEKYHLAVCADYGFTTQFTTAGYYLQRYLPIPSDYLNQTCVVRGGCFLGIGPDWGPLHVFFESKYNITYNLNGTLTEQTELLDACAYMNIAYFLLTVIFVIFMFRIIWKLVSALWDVFMETLRDLAQWPPFCYFIIWPFDRWLDPEKAAARDKKFAEGDSNGTGSKSKKKLSSFKNTRKDKTKKKKKKKESDKGKDKGKNKGKNKGKDKDKSKKKKSSGSSSRNKKTSRISTRKKDK